MTFRVVAMHRDDFKSFIFEVQARGLCLSEELHFLSSLSYFPF